MMKARYYRKQKDGIRCVLCPHLCLLKEGETGKCRTRKNSKGELFSLSYGKPCAINIDPIEKKPLNHFLPASSTFSIATAGCNLACKNCQNWQISQASPGDFAERDLSPREIVEKAVLNNCSSVSYTYTDPVVYYDYMLEIADLAREKGITNVMVSAGYIMKEPLVELCQVLDAANIDLKSFNDDLYVSLNGVRLKPVLSTLKVLKKAGVWLEITNLIIPGYTDDEQMIKQMCDWLVKNGFDNVPLHFSRFIPVYKIADAEVTPIATLNRIYDIAKASGMHYVYIGNVPGHRAQHTYCHNCQAELIHRDGYRISKFHIIEGKCEFCDAFIPGIWQ